MADIISAGSFLLFGLIVIWFFERAEKRKTKAQQIELDEHERMISQN